MKPKTGFESGSSPTAIATVRVSENGAPIQTGRGVEEAKRRITEAFDKIRQAAASRSQQALPQTPLVYAEQQRTCFHERANKLSLAALSSSHIIVKAARGPVFEIAVPTESAEELYKAAWHRRANERT